MLRSKDLKYQTTYKDYLNSLKKTEINKIISDFSLACKSSLNKETLIGIILSNLDKIVENMTGLFQSDELLHTKILIKKKGLLKIRYNYLILNYAKNLVSHNVMIAYDNNIFYMPEEILVLLKKEINKKTVLKQIKYNTKEYNLILGFVDAYGAVDFNMFYYTYSKEYKLQKEDAIKRLNTLINFYQEFKIVTNKEKRYLTSNNIKGLKEIKELINKKIDYKNYTIEELRDIHSFKYLEKTKSYRKLIKYMTKYYYIEKENSKTINKYVLTPHILDYQIDKNTSSEKLSELLDKYFESNNEKYKNRFMALIEDLVLDYPRWDLKGHSEKEKVC